MKGKRALMVGAAVVALAVPTGVAVAATTPTPTPTAPTAPAAPGGGQGYGFGHGPMGGNGWMTGGSGDPTDCPFYDSTEAQQWRDQRDERQQLTPEERQQLAEQHREQMQKLMSGTTAS